MDIGSNIKRFRELKGLTQKELADLIGVTAPTITKYEKGQMKLDFEKLDAIADALSVPMSKLYDAQSKITLDNCDLYPLEDAFTFLNYHFAPIDSEIGAYIINPNENFDFELSYDDLTEIRNRTLAYLDFELHRKAREYSKRNLTYNSEDAE